MYPRKANNNKFISLNYIFFVLGQKYENQLRFVKFINISVEVCFSLIYIFQNAKT